MTPEQKAALLLASIDMARTQGLKIPTVIEIAEWKVRNVVGLREVDHATN